MSGGCGCNSSSIDIKDGLYTNVTGNGSISTPFRPNIDCDTLVTGCIGGHIDNTLDINDSGDLVVSLSASPDNALQVLSDGIYATPLSLAGLTFGDTFTNDISGIGSPSDPVLVDTRIGTGLDSDSAGLKAKTVAWPYASGVDTASSPVYVNTAGALRSEPRTVVVSSDIASGATHSVAGFIGGPSALSGGTYTNRLSIINTDLSRSMKVDVSAGTRLLISWKPNTGTNHQAQLILEITATIGSTVTTAQVQATQTNVNSDGSYAQGGTYVPFPVQILPPGATLNVTAIVKASTTSSTVYPGFTWNDPAISAIGVSI